MYNSFSKMIAGNANYLSFEDDGHLVVSSYPNDMSRDPISLIVFYEWKYCDNQIQVN